MDWGKVLGAANVGISLMNSLALDDLREQGERAIAEQRLQELLRNRIFSLRQSAETVLSATDAPPKQQAAAMKILEWQVSDAMLKPEKFRELSDKEYVHTTGKLIREAATHFFAQLSASEQNEITEILDIYKRFPEYETYLSQYSEQLQLQEAKDFLEKHNKNGCLVALVVLVIMPLMMVSVVKNIGVGLIVSIVCITFLFYWLQPFKINKAKWTVFLLKDAEEDAVEFARLHEKFSSDTQARFMQQADKERIRAFFGNSNVLTS
jgi:hypothetical protein